MTGRLIAKTVKSSRSRDVDALLYTDGNHEIVLAVVAMKPAVDEKQISVLGCVIEAYIRIAKEDKMVI